MAAATEMHRRMPHADNILYTSYLISFDTVQYNATVLSYPSPVLCIFYADADDAKKAKKQEHEHYISIYMIAVCLGVRTSCLGAVHCTCSCNGARDVT